MGSSGCKCYYVNDNFPVKGETKPSLTFSLLDVVPGRGHTLASWPKTFPQNLIFESDILGCIFTPQKEDRHLIF